MMRSLIIVILSISFQLPNIAQATYYGDPARAMKQGGISVGIGLSELTRKVKQDVTLNSDLLGTFTSSDTAEVNYSDRLVQLGYGATDQIELLGRMGTTIFEYDSSPNETGSTVGFGFRYLSKRGDDAVANEVSVGVIGLYNYTSYTSRYEELGLMQTDILFGVSNTISRDTRLFGAGLFSSLEGRAVATDEIKREVEIAVGLPEGDISNFIIDITQDQQIGGIIGVEYSMEETVNVGAEIHLMFESGFAFFFNLEF